MTTYVIVVYALFSLTTIVGALNRFFDANLTQRLALSLLGLWAIWRITLVYEFGWSYPHEPMMVTALGLYAIGTITKTVSYYRSKFK